MNPSKTVRWALLAAGNIAAKFAEAVHQAAGSQILGVAARDGEAAAAFAARHAIPRHYAGYEAMLADPEIDAVYISTLHPFHFEWIVKSLQAGKHVLCEKPLTMSYREAQLAKAKAVECRCLLREAFMYRHHPQTQKVIEQIEAGAIGAVRVIESNFCINSGIQPESRLQAKELGGGGILDLGCYPISLARLVAGRANGRLFGEPQELKAVGQIDPATGTDMWTTALLRFERGITAKCACALRVSQDNTTYIYGEAGRIEIDSPWFCSGQIRIFRNGTEGPEVIEPDCSRSLYVYEIESFTNELNGRPLGPGEVGMRFDDSLGNLKALDRWRAEIGLRYGRE